MTDKRTGKKKKKIKPAVTDTPIVDQKTPVSMPGKTDTRPKKK